MFWGEFQVGDGTLEVSGFQPDFVSFGKRDEASVGTRGHDLAGKFMGSKGFVSGGDEGFKMGFYCGDRRVGN